MPPMSYNTLDGNPPMSLASGGTNVPPEVLQQIMQQQAQQQQLAQQQMAQQAAAMPTGNNAPIAPIPADYIPAGMPRDVWANASPDTQQRLKDMAAMQAMLNPTDAHPVLNTVAKGMMAFGQGITKQPFYTDYMNNQAAMQRANMENITASMRLNQQVPLIVIGADGKPTIQGSTLKGSIVKQTPVGVMTPEQTNSMAQQLVSGKLVPSQLTGGRTAKMQALAAAQALDPNYDPSKADVNFAASKMGAGQVEKMANTVQASHDVFRKNADYLLQESDALDRSKIPLLNKAILAGKNTLEGDPQTSRYLAAINTVASEYARLTNSPGAPTSVISDSARHEAQNILSALNTPEQLHALLDRGTGLMDKDAYSKVQAWQDRKNAYSNNPTSDQSNTVSGGNSHQSLAQQILAQRLKNGK